MSTVSFTGNIGKSQGLKFSQDGKPRLSFSAAETARVKDQSGQYVDGGTTWFNVTLFGNAAEALDATIAANGGKGKVIVTGRMSTREYEHNGEKRESLDVVADSVGLVPRNQQQGQQQGGGFSGGGMASGHAGGQATQPPAAKEDPWATPAANPNNGGGWGNGPGSQGEAPF